MYQPGPTDIAVIGMAARVPGARNVDEFWTNVRDGVESIQRLSDEELIATGVNPLDLAKSNYVKAAAILDDLASFDAGFFGLSEKDAAIMDPQHRHFLECCWEALEHSGHVPQNFPGAISVFGGCGMNAYFMFHLLTNRKLMESTGLFLVRHTGNDKDFLCTRVSYHLNLKGPSVSVQTACSTSLVAVHMASQSLINGESDMALAGGVTIEIPHRRGYLYEEGEILSHDGHCRSFDAESSGTVFGSGTGVLVLRRMQDALDDGDNILAVIRGSAVNNDGAGKVGYLAPGLDGQSAVYSEAISMSGVDAGTIRYIETHGTGTRVGDPIEVQALTQAFRRFTDRKSFCALGSVKTNIGHLDTAAGVASVIKVIQALRHRQLPPSLHFRKPNPLIAFEETPFFVNAKLQAWETGNTPRRAGVSSLGVGGTNAHLILEEAPPQPELAPAGGWQILPISARSEAALDAATDRLALALRNTPQRLEDIAFTLQSGRATFSHRRAVVGSEPALVSQTLEQGEHQHVATGLAFRDPAVVFLFAGGGAQYPGMGQGLYAESPLYREIIDNGIDLYRRSTGSDLRRWLFPAEDEMEAAARAMQRPLVGLPALFLVQYATGRLWMSLGVTPAAMIGHSVGAYAEACLAGTMTLSEGLTIVIERGRLFETLPEGGMLSIPLSESELRPFLSSGLSIAASNSPQLSVASGSLQDIAELDRRLIEKGIHGDRVNINVAAHSFMVEPILPAFRAAVAKLQLKAPEIPFVSCFKGTWATPEDAQSPDFWTNELRHTVRFAEGAGELLAKDRCIFVEVGPGHTLTGLMRLQPAFSSSHAAISSLRSSKTIVPDMQVFLQAVSQAWTRGVRLDWKELHQGASRRRVILPTYPWEHQDYWIEPGEGPELFAASSPVEAPLRRKEMEDWFYSAAWHRSGPIGAVSLAGGGPWLILSDDSEFAEALYSQLAAEGESVVHVSSGTGFEEKSGRYRIQIGEKRDYQTLFDELTARKLLPRRILHLWSRHEHSFNGLLFLAQVMMDCGHPEGAQIAVITEGMQPVAGTAARFPIQALSLGAVRVIPQEIPEISCVSIDIEPWNAGMARGVLKEAVAATQAVTIRALRGGERWHPVYQPLTLPTEHWELRDRGVYVITGGFGGIGAAISENFARSGKKLRLALIGRSIPAGDDPRAGHVLRLREMGAEVLPIAADVADTDQMEIALASVRAQFGVIHGVIHAAGVLDDGPLQLKTGEAIAAVLRPKVNGTLVLDHHLRNDGLDFFVLFSSTSALLGLAGQMDYSAANAFLDAFAASRSGVRVINWGMWRETGMTGRMSAGGVTKIYSPESHWMLAEHRLKGGPPLLPGSAYVGLAREAALGRGGRGAVVIRDLLFQSPLAVPEGQSLAVRVSLRSGLFSVSSKTSIAHATAEVNTIPPSAPIRHDLAQIEARCSRHLPLGPGVAYTHQGDYVNFGDRWNVLQGVSFGDGEALVKLELPEAYRADLSEFPLHPALFDWATSAGLPIAPGYQRSPKLHVPMSFAEIVIHHDLPARIFSHLRLISSGSGESDTVTFDVIICDEDGLELVNVHGFTLRRIEDGLDLLQLSPVPAHESPLDTIVQSAILPDEGVAAFRRILASPEARRVIVSPLPIGLLQERLQPVRRPALAQSEEAESGDEVERWLLQACRELLGVKRVGPEDDFFALGGHSLVAIRLFSKIKKAYQVELGLAALFEARPIGKLAALIRERAMPGPKKAADEPAESSPVIRIQPGVPNATTIFLVHGVGGNVVGFEPLVRRLGPGYRIYAIQSVGVDGKFRPLSSVEEMSERYIGEIQKVQPHGPYNLIGYSFGGMIAFDMCQRLWASGEQVGLLGMFDTWQHAWLPWQHRRSLPARILRHGRRVVLGPERAKYMLGNLQLLAKLTATKLKFRLGVKTSLEQGLFQIVNARAAFDYVPKPYPGRLTLFRATERHTGDPYPYHLGWEGLALGGLDIHLVPGTHLTMGEEPHVAELAATLVRCLESQLRDAPEST